MSHANQQPETVQTPDRVGASMGSALCIYCGQPEAEMSCADRNGSTNTYHAKCSPKRGIAERLRRWLWIKRLKKELDRYLGCVASDQWVRRMFHEYYPRSPREAVWLEFNL